MHTVSIGSDGIMPELWTRITLVNHQKGVAMMEIKLDNNTKVEVSLHKESHLEISDSEWNRFVKVDGKPKLRAVQLYSSAEGIGGHKLWMTQVQMNHNMFVNVHAH
ncbi:MAG: hypothetical protein L0H36_03675 [bacterium]|nr:hypothetical protein [bacterium]